MQTRPGKGSDAVECPEYLQGEIDTCCYMVKTGKPAAMIPVQKRFLDSAIERVASVHCGLEIRTEELADGWVTLWIYKYPHILEIIKSLPQAPQTPFDHWVLGKLFGYSEDSIAEYLANLDKRCVATLGAGRKSV